MHRHLIQIARGAAAGCAVALVPCAPGHADRQNPSLVERNRVLAVALLTGHGWSERQWRCLDRLWRRESNWNHRARNHWSGAYGIPQALPAVKMRSAGPDWRSSPVTQITWGLGYIARRYGSPCVALGHSDAAGWY